MKNKLFILVVLAITFTMFSVSTSSYANEIGDPIQIESKSEPSDSFLSREKRSIGASTDIGTLAAPTRGIVSQGATATGWDDPFLPGEGDGWVLGEEGNVGYPVGDASLPILLSMLFLYFIYRSVTTSRRKNNF